MILLLTNGRCPRCDRFAKVLRLNDLTYKVGNVYDIEHSDGVLGLKALPILKIGEEYIQYKNNEDTLQVIKDILSKMED